MITIYSCNSIYLYNKNIPSDNKKFSSKSIEKQEKMLVEIAARNGRIYVTPHLDSLIYKLFIKQNLNEKGFLKSAEVADRLFLLGEQIDYKIISRIDLI